MDLKPPAWREEVCRLERLCHDLKSPAMLEYANSVKEIQRLTRIAQKACGRTWYYKDVRAFEKPLLVGPHARLLKQVAPYEVMLDAAMDDLRTQHLNYFGQSWAGVRHCYPTLTNMNGNR
jgi:hypothetical protein